ncbi:hypothetical protein BGX27_002907 [Mortierella sp. AM989]|nr:hypothetical protein BGX27_002907 [Mortierella sp. AM989]
MTSRTEKSKDRPWVQSINAGRKGAAYFLELENILTAHPAGYFENRDMNVDNQKAIVHEWKQWMTTFRGSKHKVLADLAQIQHKVERAVTQYLLGKVLIARKLDMMETSKAQLHDNEIEMTGLLKNVPLPVNNSLSVPLPLSSDKGKRRKKHSVHTDGQDTTSTQEAQDPALLDLPELAPAGTDASVASSSSSTATTTPSETDTFSSTEVAKEQANSTSNSQETQPLLVTSSQRRKRQLKEDVFTTSQQSPQPSEKKVRFGHFDGDAHAPGNPFDNFSDSSTSFRPGTTEDCSEEFSVILESPQRIVRLVGPGQESSSLSLDHWIFREQDVSQSLMKNRRELVKCHETLKTVHEILQLNFIFSREALVDVTREEELAPTTCCQPIECPSIALAITVLAFTAANDGCLATIKKWKNIQRSVQIDSENEGQWDTLQTMIDHLFITSTLWSPLNYTSKRKGNEDSFCVNVVRPFLTCAFGKLPDVKLRGNGDSFTCGDELDKELKFPDFSVTMECYNESFGENYLVIAEIKPPTASQKEFDDDFIKLPNLMKLALDHQMAQGYEDGTVVGVLVQGWKVLIFHMVLEHEAVYELRIIGQFRLISDHTQIAQTLLISPILTKAKELTERTRDVLRRRPASKISSKNRLRRPSYHITPIMIYRKEDDEASNQASE